MSDLTSRYSGFLGGIAAIYADDKGLKAQLKALAITREDWDDGFNGGHLRFETPVWADTVLYDTVDAFAHDADGARIEVILHFVGGRLNWGEWFRFDGEPIRHWPPARLWRP
ncbi:MAG: hypothetical protein ABR508_09655 [Candidatus Baltobacteraceae bacterium]